MLKSDLTYHNAICEYIALKTKKKNSKISKKNQKYEFLKKETHQNSGHNSMKNFITAGWVSSTHPDL